MHKFIEFVDISHVGVEGTDSDDIIERCRDEMSLRGHDIYEWVLCTKHVDSMYVFVHEKLLLTSLVSYLKYNFIEDYSQFYSQHSEDIFKEFSKAMADGIGLPKFDNYYDTLIAAVYIKAGWH